MATLAFKLTPEEARRIRRQARHEKLTVSQYLRCLARGASFAPTQPIRIRCAKTGALIFAPPSQSPPLTTAGVKKQLAEFP